jgi:hypothetical protein
MQGDTPSSLLFNIFFDFVMQKVIEQADAVGVKLAYGSNDFFHTNRDKYNELNILTLMYADDW